MENSPMDANLDTAAHAATTLATNAETNADSAPAAMSVAIEGGICPDIAQIPLDQLQPWDNNPRQTMTSEGIARLKASLRASGMLQNCVAVPRPEGGYWVIAGERRWVGLTEMAEAGEIPADTPINCAIRQIDPSDPEALMAALAENDVREQMDPIDVCITVAQLAGKRTVGEIATAFGLATKTVKQHIRLGRLVAEAQELIRGKERDIEWGKALAAADQPTQTKICADIAMNANAWADAQSIRRFLMQDTIPAKHALFDLTRYQGRIVHDMFDGDFLADRDEFWQLQDEAIDIEKAKLESEGYAEVRIQNEPFDPWRYRSSDIPAESIAIVEKLPNGKVNVHRGLVDEQAHDPDLDDTEEAEAGDPSEPETQETLPGHAVRATPAILDYMAAHRSAMVQAKVASTFRTSLEVMTAALIGHSDIAMRAQDYAHPGGPDIRSGAHFEAMAGVREAVNAEIKDLGAGAERDRAILALVQSLDDNALPTLFTQLTALKLGQHKARRIDDNPDGLMALLGQDIDIRANWTPDESFFELMQPADLRRLATNLLPLSHQRGVTSAKKPHLVRLLADTFAAAADNDGSLDAASARRLNAWIPGAMQFPAFDDALVETAADDTPDASDAGDDAFDAIFTGTQDAA